MARKIDRDDYVWMGDHHFNGNVTGIEGSGGGDGVESISGDGVDNSDPKNPVISYPDPSDIGAATANQGALAETAVQPGDLPATPTWTTIEGKPSFVAEGANAAAARTALGLGTAATTASTAYATASQGALADTAVQPSGLPTWATISGKPAFVAEGASASAARTSLGLGTAATTAASAYATAAQGELADTALQPAAIANMVESEQEGGVGTLIKNIVAMTQAQYDGLSSTSPSTYYVIIA